MLRQHSFPELVLPVRHSSHLVRRAAFRLAGVDRERRVAAEQVRRALDRERRAVALAPDSPARPPLAVHSAVAVAVRASVVVAQTQSAPSR
jgi:hypothetical protein